MKNRKLVACISMFIIVSASVFGAADFYADDIYLPSAVNSGLGGPYATDNQGLDCLFANPAGFRSAAEGLAFTNLTLQLKGPIFDITSLVIGSMAGGSDITSILTSDSAKSILSNLYAGMTLSGPLYFGYAGNGLGFGLFNSTDFTIKNKSALSIAMNISEDVILCGGYAFRIPFTQDERHSMDIGIMLKGGVRGRVKIEKSLLELPSMLSSIGPQLLTGEPFEFDTLIGLDAGFRYTWKDMLSAGISLQDIYTPVIRNSYSGGLESFMAAGTPETTNGIIPFKVNAGVEISPRIEIIEKYISDFRFMLEYRDIFDFLLYPEASEHPLLHLKTGLEITMLEILDIRVGLAEGLLNAGFGLELGVFELNAAMFGTEISSQPGMRPVYNLIIGFTI